MAGEPLGGHRRIASTLATATQLGLFVTFVSKLFAWRGTLLPSRLQLYNTRKMPGPVTGPCGCSVALFSNAVFGAHACL